MGIEINSRFYQKTVINFKYYLLKISSMEINKLKVGQTKVDLEAQVVSVEEPKEFEKFGNRGRVANAMITDKSGEIKLTLWNDEIDRVKVGDKIKITNGFVKEFQGEKQLTAGKFGKIEII